MEGLGWNAVRIEFFHCFHGFGFCESCSFYAHAVGHVLVPESNFHAEGCSHPSLYPFLQPSDSALGNTPLFKLFPTMLHPRLMLYSILSLCHLTQYQRWQSHVEKGLIAALLSWGIVYTRPSISGGSAQMFQSLFCLISRIFSIPLTVFNKPEFNQSPPLYNTMLHGLHGTEEM